MIIPCKECLDKENSKWNHIEDDWNINQSMNLVVYSGNLVEQRSIFENYIFTSVYIFWRMMTNSFEIVVTEWFKVELRHLHNYMEGNEMNNAMFNIFLKRQQPTIDEFAIDCSYILKKSNVIGNARSSPNKQRCLIVSKLHNFHSLHNLWVEHQMQTNCTWEFDKVNSVVIWKKKECFLLFFLFDHWIKHTTQHEILPKDQHKTVETIVSKNSLSEF